MTKNIHEKGVTKHNCTISFPLLHLKDWVRNCVHLDVGRWVFNKWIINVVECFLIFFLFWEN